VGRHDKLSGSSLHSTLARRQLGTQGIEQGYGGLETQLETYRLVLQRQLARFDSYSSSVAVGPGEGELPLTGERRAQYEGALQRVIAGHQTAFQLHRLRQPGCREGQPQQRLFEHRSPKFKFYCASSIIQRMAGGQTKSRTESADKAKSSRLGPKSGEPCAD